jgi:hypothetical protein
MKTIGMFLLGIFLSGCASTHQYLPVSDINNLAPGNVLIKVERRYEFMGGGRSVEVSDDGKVVGQVARGETLIWQRPAGIFEIQLVPAVFIVSDPVPIKVDGKSGKQYDFEIFWGGNKFEFQRRIP